MHNHSINTLIKGSAEESDSPSTEINFYLTKIQNDGLMRIYEYKMKPVLSLNLLMVASD